MQVFGKITEVRSRINPLCPSVNRGLSESLPQFIFKSTSDRRAFFVGGIKCVGSRFQVEIRKTKWEPIISVSHITCFSKKKQRYIRALTLFHMVRGVESTPPYGIGLSESLPQFIFKTTSDRRAFFVGGIK